MSNYRFINREISWLGFNERVLREAEDERVPLLEKLKFLAIFSSNLDEFFMIRVAGLMDQVNAGYTKTDISGHTPEELLHQISDICHKLVKDQQTIFNSVKKECAKHHIVIEPNIEGDLEEIVESIFTEEIMPLVSPVTLSSANPFPFIYNLRHCIFVELEKDGKKHYSIIIIPENLQRVFKVKLHRTYFLTSEEIIAKYLQRVFPGYDVKDSYMLRLTRNADLSVEEEEAEDLLKLIQKKLPARKKGNVVRVEIDKRAPDEVFSILKEHIHFEDEDVYVVDKPLDLTFLFAVSGENKELAYPVYTPYIPYGLKADETIFDRIKERDYIFYRPYHDFALISGLIRVAARDRDVLSIKMTLYRANKGSSIMESLAEAARAGKQVCVVIELKARFDEERNVEWATKLEEAGCIVTYGIAGLKIHSKNLMIVRKEQGRIVRYNHLSTGNYNESTANLYTDIDYLTADDEVGEECANLFNMLMGYTDYVQWKHLYPAPTHIKPKILEFIDNEMEYARKGKKAEVIVKVNSLIDKPLMEKIYDASRAGVKIKMIIRGICGITAGEKGLSENIQVRSIVGRFLEHPRIVYFHNGGKPRVFISTADWMERNMDRRVEQLFEVKDKEASRFLIKILECNLEDNTKAWELRGDVYEKVQPSSKEKPFGCQQDMIDNGIE
ncbi:polyphosphate kinase 1 [Limisalsivibrio acetivorans]|uniref:polyphosphate kinase 1 n=1 Tax=Limisalsivibrio acetivorans TaxID=1304888 RepID=UPI0003B58D8E|nr:polyphosphate kinase 1 [Limisalsivibrio acetivorans]